MKRILKEITSIYFYIGVNVIGLPLIHKHIFKNTPELKNIGSKFFTILLASAICSCGARKVDKTVTEENSVVSKMEHTESNVNKDVSITENKTDCSETTTETYAPQDPTKPAYFTDDSGNKKELNNTSYQKKKTVKHIQENKSVLKYSDSDLKTDTSTLIGKNIKTDDVHVQRDAISQWNWLWLIIPIIIAYIIWRKSNPVDQVENVIEDIIKKI